MSLEGFAIKTPLSTLCHNLVLKGQTFMEKPKQQETIFSNCFYMFTNAQRLQPPPSNER